jgi:hypothetical protein
MTRSFDSLQTLFLDSRELAERSRDLRHVSRIDRERAAQMRAQSRALRAEQAVQLSALRSSIMDGGAPR